MRRTSTTTMAWLITAVALFCGSGATCRRGMLPSPFGPMGPAAPQVLADGASREQIVAAVNANSARVRSIAVTGATITVPNTMGLPLLAGNIAAERPARFRLTAGTAITGQEIDLGSNDERFWIWSRRNQPPAVYYCRHDQFANSAIREVMPIEPSWLLAALGMVDLDPALVYDGPTRRADGTVELRSWLPSSSGTLNRVTVVDARRAWVVEQHIYDPSGTTLLASAVAESFRYYPAQQVSLPERVAIKLPTANLSLKIDLGTVQINQLVGNPQQLWAMPTFEGYAQYDLSGAVPGTPLPGVPSTGSYAPTPAPPATSYVPAPAAALPTAPTVRSTSSLSPVTFRAAAPVPPVNCLPSGGVVQTGQATW